MTKLVISNSTRIRWIGGKIELASESSGRYIRTQDPEVIALLNAFATPISVEDVAAMFTDFDPSQFANAIAGLKAIRVLVPESVHAIETGPATGEAKPVHRVSWQTFFARLQKRWDNADFLRYDDLNMTVTNCGKENLSPGCVSCKDGGWVCFYPGFRCNARCGFCPQPAHLRSRNDKHIGTAFVDEMCEFLIQAKDKITGVSLSGGELFLYREAAQKVMAVVQKHLPDVWVWAYTNGISVTPDHMKLMRDLGLDELRFDLAATDFDEKVISKIEDHAVDIIPWVTVEIPAISETHRKLVEEGQLQRLADMGVKQLNLAQLCIPAHADTSPAYLNYAHGGHHFYRFDSFKPGTDGELYSMESRFLTYDILQFAHQEDIDIRINDCSSEAKEVQRLARHMNWGAQLMTMKRHSYPRFAPPPSVNVPPPESDITDSGLASLVLKTGTGAQKPGPDDYVTVHYVGWTTDGQMFDSSVLRDQKMTVSLQDVIEGWAEGLQLMVAGEKRRFWIPKELAYDGESGKPQGMLVFDVELFDILD